MKAQIWPRLSKATANLLRSNASNVPQNVHFELTEALIGTALNYSSRHSTFNQRKEAREALAKQNIH